MGNARTRPIARKSTTRNYKVFVSHATADKWLATTICEMLKTRGVSTFRDDRDIAGGDDIPDTLVKEIVGSQELVVILTPESLNRTWVTLEIGAAWGRKRRIIVILNHVNIDVIPAIIKSKKAFQLNDLDRYLNEVAIRAQDHAR
jgi:hypothetical protein